MELVKTKQQEFSAFAVIICIALAILMIFCGAVFADDCQDPDKLTPELKEAYYQLKELEKQIAGMTVKIRCEMTKPLTIGDLYNDNTSK